MPPRFAYWTILIDNSPTAFRAGEADELLPTLAQLKRTNENVVLKWFARGRLWESRQEERDDFQRRKERRSAPGRGAHHDKIERRSKDWRPGGDHKDPRARFDKKKRRDEKREQPWPKRDASAKPWERKPSPGGKPWQAKPSTGAKPWQRKSDHRKWQGKPKPAGRPWQSSNRFKPSNDAAKPFPTKWPKRKHHARNDEPEDD